MRTVGVTAGSDADADRVARRLVDGLSDEGRVALVRERTGATGGVPNGSHAGGSPAPAATTYRVDDDGWSATGDDRSLTGVLDDLAPDHDYAVVVGFPGADLPRVVVGNPDRGDADGDSDPGAGDDPHTSAGDPVATAADPGAVDPETVRDRLAEREPHRTLSSLVAEAKRSPRSDRAGAIATFTGRVRVRDGPEDAPTEYLEFEKYEGVAADRMDAIAAELTERTGVFEVLMHHRTGVIERGEDIVFVVVLAGHREEAFRTVSDGIDRLKAEVPIFKREVTVEEEFWVHERE